MWQLLSLCIAVLPAALPLLAAERLAWERELLAAHRAGDPAAFEALYRAYAATLYARVLLPLLRQPALAEDALADCFTRAHAALHDYRAGERSLYFWLSRIARNRALDLQRHRAVQLRTLPVFHEEARLAAGEDNPETLLVARSETEAHRRRVDQVLSGLTPRYRRALELRFFEELAREACAQQLEIKLGTFDVLLLRALQAFRREWLKAFP